MNIRVRLGEAIVIALVCLVSLILLISGYQQNNEILRHRLLSATSETLSADANDIIGPSPDYLGDPKSAFTLVEFGDYQCPPCHHVADQVASLVSNYHGKLKFAFRNLPLSTIHPYAMQAAVAAEVAEEKNVFWSVHDKLYAIDVDQFNKVAIEEVLSSSGIARRHDDYPKHGVEYRAIERDIQQAKKLGINATPTFILCCPNNKKFKLNNVDDVRLILDNSTSSRF